MSCCDHDSCHAPSAPPPDARYRRVLWAALAINAAMFAIEIGAGVAAGSVSLFADSLDFFGDSANYALSLAVVGMGLARRANAALAKGMVMAAFGVWVIVAAVWHAAQGTMPAAATMGAVGFLALLANVVVVGVLWAYRRGDSDMRAVWLCSRNDALGNVAVMLAAAGVFGTGTGWPDIIVAALMAGLALQGAWSVIGHAKRDRRMAAA